MSRRNPLAALAAVTAALALVVPVAGASAATTAPAATAAVAPPSAICVLLQKQLRFATQTGNTVLAGLLSRVVVLMHC
jgi:hypothetical protein